MQYFAKQRIDVTMKLKGSDTMASNKFQGGKCKGGSHAKAFMRHNDISIESRKIAAIENPHIDISKSHLNYSFDGLTYQQRCRRYDKRIKELDSTTNTNKRKDRVTMQGIEIPVPKELPEEQYHDWFKDVCKIYINHFGAENVMYFDVHVDEVHDYIDSVTGEWETSRVHAHCGVIPEIDGVLNGKAFSSRTNMRKLNKAVEDMTTQKYGCKFQTGEKRKSKQTIDELKNKSAELEFEEQQRQLELEWNTIATEKANIRAEKKRLKADREAFEVETQETTQQIKKTLNEANNALNESKKLHFNMQVQSSYYCKELKAENEKKIVELDSKLSVAYDLANQQRNGDTRQYG